MDFGDLYIQVLSSLYGWMIFAGAMWHEDEFRLCIVEVERHFRLVVSGVEWCRDASECWEVSVEHMCALQKDENNL